VGPHIVDPTTGAVTGSLPTGKKVIAVDRSAGHIYLWDIITSGFFERVYEYDLNLSGVLRQWDFSPIIGVYSYFGFDFARGKMYVGYLDRGVLDVVELGPAPADPIPALSQWGAMVMTLALLAGGTVVIRAKEHRQAVGESAR
jgi:hypothetical protein